MQTCGSAARRASAVQPPEVTNNRRWQGCRASTSSSILGSSRTTANCNAPRALNGRFRSVGISSALLLIADLVFTRRLHASLMNYKCHCLPLFVVANCSWTFRKSGGRCLFVRFATPVCSACLACSVESLLTHTQPIRETRQELFRHRHAKLTWGLLLTSQQQANETT